MFKFKKKKEDKSMTYDEVMQCINSLSDEEREKIKIGLTNDSEENDTAEQGEEPKDTTEPTAEPTEPTTESTAETASDTEDVATDDSAAETVAETTEQENGELEEKSNEVVEALSARVDAMDGKIDKLMEVLNVAKDAKEKDFGASSKMQADNNNGYANRDQQVMDSYYKGKKSAYM